MVLLLILLFILLLLLWVLFTPIFITLNSQQNEYSVKMPGLLSTRILWMDERLIVRLRVLFFRTEFYPLEGKPSKTKSKKPRRRRSSLSFTGVKKLAGTFRVKRCLVEVDTDDFVSNAWLHLGFGLLNHFGNVDFRVNYEGRLTCDVLIQNRPSRILWTLIKQKF